MTCSLCGGQLGLLGALGNLKWLVCRDCGMQFSKKVRKRTAKKKAGLSHDHHKSMVEEKAGL